MTDAIESGATGAAPVIRLVSCVGVAFDLEMLPHFLRHYAGLGIAPDRMHLTLHSEDADSPRLAEAERLLAAFGTAEPARWIGPYTSDGMWQERRRLQREVAEPSDWIVNSDIDEHYVFPAPLPEVIAECDALDATCLQGLQVDRFAPDGTLSPVLPRPAMEEQFPVEGEASFHVFGTGEHHGVSATTKLMLHRADVLPRRGGHNPEGLDKGSRAAEGADGPRFLLGRPLHTIPQIRNPAFRFAFPFQSRHYKWTAARRPSIERRVTTEGVSPAGLEYGQKVLDFLAENGRVPLDRVALRGPADRPQEDWRAAVSALRADPRARLPRPGQDAAATIDRNALFVVIRAAGERTEAVCRALVAREVADDRIAVLHEVPFATAVRRSFEHGLAAGAEWTLCLDADVLLRPGALSDLLEAAGKLDPEAFGVNGRVADRLLGQRRVAGHHLYRTSLLAPALKHADFDASQRRPESRVKRAMAERGHAWVNADVMVGLHNFEQSYADIFRTTAVQARKHERHMDAARRYWTRCAAEDGDLRVALWTLEAPERIAPLPPRGEGTRSISIDRRLFPDDISGFLGQIGLTEKPPLPADAITPAEVMARMAAFEEAPEWTEQSAVLEAGQSALDGTGPAVIVNDWPKGSTHPVLVSCIGVDGPAEGDLPLVQHWLAHYAALGVPPERMRIILNAATADSPTLVRARKIFNDAGVPEPDLWIGTYTSQEMWDRRAALQARVVQAQDWVVNADADEFHEYPAPLPEVIAALEARGALYVQGPFVDRVAEDGRLAAVQATPNLAEQFPEALEVGLSLGKTPGEDDGTGTVKLMLHRGDVIPSLGGHGVKARKPEEALYALPLMRFPRVKAPAWRASLPFRVHHYKWTSGLAERVDARRSAPGASPAGSRYGGRILDHLTAGEGALPLDRMPAVPPFEGNWLERIDAVRQEADAIRPVLSRAGRLRTVDIDLKQHAADGWRVRQLTFGTAAGRYHAHSYYDIPVLTDDGTRAAAYRMGIVGRWMTPDDAVEIGIVDVERGGFRRIGRSRAWSWQQGPMAQWLPDGRQLVWNDRHRDGPTAPKAGDAFVARLYDTETGTTRTLPRTVYALTPSGDAALSVNMARLDHARPGYGYPGGAGAQVGVGAPENDGVWKMSLHPGGPAPDLILPLSRAVAFLAEHLPKDEREAHLSGALSHWFNHLKVSPDGRRFTTKLRWRAAGFEGKWTGHMGVSLTCGMDGRGLSLLARGTSHVMWLDAETLCFWHQAEGRFATARDAIPEATDYGVPYPELIVKNVHFRHVEDVARLAVFDTPYAEEVEVNLLDRQTGVPQRLARFGGHVPPHGPFRCDLHPVPSRDGSRILVTSLHDGGRQLYVVERTDLS